MHGLPFYIHIASLCLAGLGVLFADHAAFDWMRGKRRTLSGPGIAAAHWIVTIGLSCLIISGLVLFWPLREYLVGETLFWVKLGFVFALLVNSFFIEHLMHTAERRPFASLSMRERAPLFISGAVSTISWLGAAGVAIILF
jgi:hypothetical protein